MALTIPVSTDRNAWAESDSSQQREGTLGALRLETRTAAMPRRVRILQRAEEATLPWKATEGSRFFLVLMSI